MKPKSRLYKAKVLVAAFAFSGAALNAQTPTPIVGPAVTAAPHASVGSFNDWLRRQNPLFDDFDLGVQFRARYVYQTYFAIPGAGPTAVDLRADTPYSVNDFLLLRTRVHAGYSPADWLT